MPNFPKYDMIIQRSEEDEVFVVSLPEFPQCKTHGESYAEAVQSSQDMIESLVDFYIHKQKPLPHPPTFPRSPLQIV